MVAQTLVRGTSHGVTLLGDPNRPGGVTLAFTERTGGVSEGAFASLNLGDRCQDDPHKVEVNRQRALRAIGAGGLMDRLVCPKQVHGDNVVLVGGAGLGVEEARRVAADGADAVVCLSEDVPVLLCFADCVPVILAAPGAFAVIHSGWKGTYARIAAKALHVLEQAAACDASEVVAYVGPHIGVDDYEVSQELADRFAGAFGNQVIRDGRHLDLGAAVEATLIEAGVRPDAVRHVPESTASNTDRFFSYRAQGGTCGRHGALACRISGRHQGT